MRIGIITAISITLATQASTSPSSPDFMTSGELQEAQKAYKDLLKNEGCDAALPKIERFTVRAAVTLEVLTPSLSPFIRAAGSSSEIQVIQRDKELFAAISVAEKTVQRVKNARNAALVDMAECLHQLDRSDESISTLAVALNNISALEKTSWRRARQLLGKITGWSLQ